MRLPVCLAKVSSRVRITRCSDGSTVSTLRSNTHPTSSGDHRPRLKKRWKPLASLSATPAALITPVTVRLPTHTNQPGISNRNRR